MNTLSDEEFEQIYGRKPVRRVKKKNILEQNYYCIDNTYRHCDWSGKADSLGSIKDQRRRYAKNKQGIE